MSDTIHPTDRMTSRQRMLAAYRGQEVDRLPYWPKMGGAWLKSQPEAIRAMPHRALLDYVFADGIFGCWVGIDVDRPHVKVETVRNPDGSRWVVTRTPDGDLTERWARDAATDTEHPVEFPVKTVEDIRRWRWVFRDVKIEVKPGQRESLAAFAKDVGQRGVIVTHWGTSPLMDLVEHIIGPVETHILLHEHRAEMEELIDLMHQYCRRRVEAVAAQNTVADVVVSVENTSTTLISPEQFSRYCLGHLNDYCRIINKHGKMAELHMCGHIKALLPMIETIPAASIEAFTSPTVGNTRLVDGRTLSPGKALLGGTNVTTWLRPVHEIQRYIEGELAVCPDHRRIVLTTAGVAPPACSAETFRQIGQWIPSVAVRL